MVIYYNIGLLNNTSKLPLSYIGEYNVNIYGAQIVTFIWEYILTIYELNSRLIFVLIYFHIWTYIFVNI